jgi:hypothetical protein
MLLKNSSSAADKETGALIGREARFELGRGSGRELAEPVAGCEAGAAVTHLPTPSALAWTLFVAMLSRMPKNCMAKRALPDQSAQLAKSIGPLL